MATKKKAPMDKLSLDMIQCEKDGFGVHYGAWRAAQYEKNGGMPQIQKRNGYKRICINCGKEFYVKTNRVQKYCDEFCKEQCYRRQKAEARANGKE